MPDLGVSNATLTMVSLKPSKYAKSWQSANLHTYISLSMVSQALSICGKRPIIQFACM